MTDIKPVHLDFSKKYKPKWKRCGRKSELRIYLETPNIQFKYVNSINLSHNFLIWDDIENDLPMIFQKCSRLKHLDLSDNYLGGRPFIQFLINSLEKYSQLCITISGNPKDLFLKEFLNNSNNQRIIYEEYEFYDIDKLFYNQEDLLF